GFLLMKELKALGALAAGPDRPYMAVLGGAKVSDKIGVIEALLGKVDALLVGGAMANTFLASMGREMGRSLVETEKLALAGSRIASRTCRRAAERASSSSKDASSRAWRPCAYEPVSQPDHRWQLEDAPHGGRVGRPRARDRGRAAHRAAHRGGDRARVHRAL